jgi:hypothetical protein
MTRSLEQEGNLGATGDSALRRRLDHLELEIRKLWAGVNKRSNNIIDMPFSWSGPPAGALGDLSAPWLVPHGGHTVRFILTAGVAPSSGTLTVGVYKNGEQFTTVSLATGQNRVQKAYQEDFDSDYDMMQVAYTSFGTGAADVTIQARVRTR